MGRSCALVVICVIACVGCAGEVEGDRTAASHGDIKSLASTTRDQVCPDGDTTEGIDVSHWQYEIDWEAAAAGGTEFAFIRVAYGSGTVDDYFAANWEAAKEAGVLRGVYQYFLPSQDATAQAQLVVDQLSENGFDDEDMSPVIDVEETTSLSDDELYESLTTWLDHVELNTGRKGIIYSAMGFWNAYLGDYTGAFDDYPKWVANWDVGCPNMPAGWGSWDFWQYTVDTDGDTPGVSGACDRDVFNGTHEDLLDYIAASAGTSDTDADTDADADAGADADADTDTDADTDADADADTDADTDADADSDSDSDGDSDADGDSDDETCDATGGDGDCGCSTVGRCGIQPRGIPLLPLLF